MNTANHILLAEDDTNLSYLMQENLQAKGFTVTLASTGTAALEALKSRQFSLCILDVMLPGTDGFTVAAQLRQQYASTPFIFLTARNMEHDKLHGFEIGADDYITKPFSFKELHYRIVAILRRTSPQQADAVQSLAVSLGPAILHPAERILEVNGERRKLSQREAAILQLLLQHSGTYMSRRDILKQIWGNDDYFTAKSMDVYINRIRKLLKDVPEVEVENLYGVGYRIRLAGAA